MDRRHTTTFYDNLAADYHLNYADWSAAILRQGNTLAGIIKQRGVPDLVSVLDCACGIGTQALGLATLGFQVAASDVSAGSVARARNEAAIRDLTISFHVADFRTLEERIDAQFDVIVCCDNSLPHLLTDTDLVRALRSMYARAKPGGIVIVGIRDYDTLIQERPQATLPHVVNEPNGRSVVFQVWDWQSDAPTYDVNLFVVKQSGDDVQTTCHTARYRALLRHELDRFLEDAGFKETTWLFPSETQHHQPLVVARRPHDIDR